MKRQEFIDEINTIEELLSFCSDYDCDVMDSVYTDDGKDDYIHENQLMDWARDDCWWDLRDRLDNIPTGYDYYILNDWGEWIGLTDDGAAEYKDAILEWADDCGDVWDDEEEIEEPDEEQEDADEEEDEDVGCDIYELFSMTPTRANLLNITTW